MSAVDYANGLIIDKVAYFEYDKVEDVYLLKEHTREETIAKLNAHCIYFLDPQNRLLVLGADIMIAIAELMKTLKAGEKHD